MQTATATTQHIIEQIKVLPPESLDELATYVDFLRYKNQGASAATAASGKLRIVNLRGLLKGYDFSPEFLAEARNLPLLTIDHAIAQSGLVEVID